YDRTDTAFNHYRLFILTATFEIYSLSLHDALPICSSGPFPPPSARATSSASSATTPPAAPPPPRTPSSRSRLRIPSTRGSKRASDRKSTRLNSSHVKISYAVFCLKKKNEMNTVNNR